MDKEEMLERSGFNLTRKTSWFERNVEKLEILFLFLIFVALIAASGLMYLTFNKVNSMNLTCPECTQTVEYLKIKVVNSKNVSTFEDIVEVNSSFSLTNVAVGDYFLEGNESVLFTTTSATNTVKCSYKDTLDSVSCVVTETGTTLNESTTTQTTDGNIVESEPIE